MKLRSLAIGSAAALAVAAFTAGSAGASTVAAWDFSQYFGSGANTTDGTTFAPAQVVDANYSDLDPTGVGAESAQYGTLFLDGTAGSSTATLQSPFVPNSEDLNANNDVLDTVGVFLGEGAMFNDLAAEGQTYTHSLGFRAADVGSVVFAADLSSIPEFGEDWVLSFGGKTELGGNAEVGVEFSPDGSSFQSLPAVTLTGSESVFSVPTSGTSGDRAFFRMNFSDGIPNGPIVDNVAINTTLVPEPGTALLLGGGLAGLAGLGRRRRA